MHHTWTLFQFFFCGQPTCRFPCLRESAGDDPPEAADVNAPQQQKKNNKKMEENCVELILFGDSGHFVLTSILQIIALCWLLNFKYAAKYQVKSLKSGPTGNLTSKKLKWAILKLSTLSLKVAPYLNLSSALVALLKFVWLSVEFLASSFDWRRWFTHAWRHCCPGRCVMRKQSISPCKITHTWVISDESRAICLLTSFPRKNGRWFRPLRFQSPGLVFIEFDE